MLKKYRWGGVCSRFCLYDLMLCRFFYLFCSMDNIYAQICFVYENILLNLQSKLCDNRLCSLKNVQPSLRFTRYTIIAK